MTTIEWLPVADVEAGALGLPDTPVARACARLSAEASEDYLANHQTRSYLWGHLLAGRDGIAFDHEAVFVSALLHDIGLTDTFPGGECFEEVGGEAAARFLRELGWPADRAAGVKRSIVLHVEKSVPLEAGVDAHVLDLGVSCDISGRRLDEIDVDDRERVLAAYPRHDLKRRFIERLRRDAAERPTCATARWFDEMNLEDRVLSAGFEE